MVISHCQDYESIACALRSALLKSELKEKQPEDWKKQPQDVASGQTNHSPTGAITGTFRIPAFVRRYL